MNSEIEIAVLRKMMTITKTWQLLVGNGWMLGCSFLVIHIFLFYLFVFVLSYRPGGWSLITRKWWWCCRHARWPIVVNNIAVDMSDNKSLQSCSSHLELWNSKNTTCSAANIVKWSVVSWEREWGLKLARETRRRGTVVLGISKWYAVKMVCNLFL